MTEKAKPQSRIDYEGVKKGFHLEADRESRGMSVIISDIIGISDFSDSLIYLQSHGGRITVSGRNLLLCVLEGGNVEIAGKVEGISFKYGKN